MSELKVEVVVAVRVEIAAENVYGVVVVVIVYG